MCSLAIEMKYTILTGGYNAYSGVIWGLVEYKRKNREGIYN